MRNVLLVKYGEIATRGSNRYLVENRLIKTIIGRLADLPGYRVYKEQGRLLVVNEEGEFDYDEVIPRVVTTLGVTAVCPICKSWVTRCSKASIPRATYPLRQLQSAPTKNIRSPATRYQLP